MGCGGSTAKMGVAQPVGMIVLRVREREKFF